MLPNSFKNPLTPVIADPVGIDRPIQELQQTLAALGWLEKSFGRSWLSYRQDVLNGKIVTYPQVWQGMDNGKDRDLLDVMPNDNLKSQSFFKVNDPIETINYRKDLYSEKRAIVDIIFWFNLREIHATVDYRFIELLKTQAEDAVRKHMFTVEAWANVELVRSWEDAANVFKGYTIPDKRPQLIHPFGGFRLETRLTWRENCPLPSLPA